MRISKKTLKTATRSLHRRIIEVCKINSSGHIQEEFKRAFPNMEPTPNESDCLRILLLDALELAIPSHWCE